MIKGAIFDVDGTILNSMDAWQNVILLFLKQYNINFSNEEFNEFKTMTLDESLPLLKSNFNIKESFDEILAFLTDNLKIEYEKNITAKAGACKYLKKLHDSGVKIALATSGIKESCKAAFTRLGIWQYIDAYAFSSEVGVNKSNPDVYLLAAKRLGLSPSDCIVYEDIEKGIIGAKKGGFKTCAVFDSSNAMEFEALKDLADDFIVDFTELL